MQNVRDPLGLAFLDAVPLGIVAGGGRKGRMTQSRRNLVRGCSRLQRERRVQAAKAVGTNLWDLQPLTSFAQPLVSPIRLGLLWKVRSEDPLCRRASRTVAGEISHFSP